tara:strand:- start:769 stop:1056 length:288 start_codon:yes stop_codon:yes gene_type:complete
MRQKKGKKMNNKVQIRGVKITHHFWERYNERILLIPTTEKRKCSKNAVKRDLKKRLTENEKKCIDLLSSCNKQIKIPLGQINTMIIKNGNFITVY